MTAGKIQPATQTSLASPHDAVARLLARLSPVKIERLPLHDAAGRVLAEPVTSDGPSPPCDVSAMDGCAVRLADLPLVGWDSLTVAAVVAAALLWPGLSRVPVLLITFLAGFGLLAAAHPAMLAYLRPEPPALVLHWPPGGDWWIGLTRGALPQLPLTLMNSVVAICALSADLDPERGLRPRRVAASVGLMNLLTVPLGGLPVCHGADGLAAQHRFGAHTGGSVVMLGGVKIAAGVALGSMLLPLLQAYPRSILAVMLVLAGALLARPTRDRLRGWSLSVVAVTVLGIFAFDTAVGTLMGCGAAAVAWRFQRRPST